MSNLLQNYNRAPVNIVKGEGCELIADDGTRYLDAIGGIAVCALGHAHPAITEAITQQAQTLVHASNLFHHEPAATLARELAGRSGFDRVFFCNSGTEANEAAIKLARKVAYRRGDSTRTAIVSCTGSFHGRTLGALAATANPAYHEGFGPMPEGFRTTPFNDVASLDEALATDVAAFIVEPVQGESGVHVATEGFLRRARELCTARGIVLIFDEIQCGMGRLGPLFAFQKFGVKPDVVTLAKALANGLPIGAVLVTEAFADGLRPGDHGTTFGGSPIPCAAALAHLRVRDELDLEKHVEQTGDLLTEALEDLHRAHPNVYEKPRVAGLLAGLPVNESIDAGTLVTALREKHAILANKAGGNTIRFAPPLIVDSSDVQRLRDALDAVASAAT